MAAAAGLGAGQDLRGLLFPPFAPTTGFGNADRETVTIGDGTGPPEP